MKAAFLLFIIALVARLVIFGALVSHYGTGSFYLANYGAVLTNNDSQNYVTIAKNLVEHKGYSRFVEAPFEPDSFRTPLLAFYFVPFVYFFGFSYVWLAMLVLDIILSATAVAAYYLAKLFLPSISALWVGGLVALEPLLVYRTNIAEPDALIVLLLILALYYFVRFARGIQSNYLYLSFFFLALLSLAKPVGTYLIYFFAIAAGTIFWARKTPLRDAAKQIIIALAIAGGLLFPWLWRNSQAFGKWSMSSITAYNFYYYYTGNISLPDEKWPSGQITGRDPIRNLKNEDVFLGIAKKRIRHQPLVYLKQHLIGTVRNFFASDLVGFYNNGHQELLPVPYSPVNQVNFTALFASGEFRALALQLSSPGNFFYLLRHVGLALFYLIILYQLIPLYLHDRRTFWWFTFFNILVLYFVFTPGTFVDAKYRLPVVPLLLIMFFHFFSESNKERVT